MKSYASPSALPAQVDPEEALAGWTNPGLDYPTFRLSLVAKAIDRLTLRMLSAHSDLAIAEWRVLSRLAPMSGATVRQIAEMAWVDRAEVSRAAASLEQRGYTSRRDNPQDGRAPILFCTARGLEAYRELLPHRASFHASLSEDLSKEDRDEFDAILVKIARRVGKLANS